MLGKSEMRPDDSAQLVMLAASLEISLIGFAVGGFFLSQAYGTLMYVMIALTLVTVLFIKHGKLRYAWIPVIPLVWDLVVTMTASWQKVFSGA